MAALHNDEMTIETTIKHILGMIIGNVEYEMMEEELLADSTTSTRYRPSGT